MEKQQNDDYSSGDQLIPSTAPNHDEQTANGYSRQNLAIAASIALLLISLALVVFVFNQYATINNQETRITELETELEQKEEMLSILETRTVNLVALNGLKVNPSGYGKIIWDAEKQQALLQVSNLPAVPEGKAYQLWLIKNNKPVPSATFSVRNTGGDGSFFKIEQLAEANQQNTNAFAITLEPEGGSRTPTGATYLLGNVSPPTTNNQ